MLGKPDFSDESVNVDSSDSEVRNFICEVLQFNLITAIFEVNPLSVNVDK